MPVHVMVDGRLLLEHEVDDSPEVAEPLVRQGLIAAQLLPEGRTVLVRNSSLDRGCRRLLAPFDRTHAATERDPIVLARITVERPEGDIHPGFRLFMSV